MNKEEQLELTRERVMRYMKMHIEEGLNYSEIARREGVTRASVSASMKLIERFPDLKEKMDAYLEDQEIMKGFRPLIERQHKSYIKNLDIYKHAYPIYRYIVLNHATYKQAAEYFQYRTSSIIQNTVEAISRVSPTAKENLEEVKRNNYHHKHPKGRRNFRYIPSTPEGSRAMEHIQFILKYECGIKGATLCMGATPRQIGIDIKGGLVSNDEEMREQAQKAQQIVSTFRNGKGRFIDQKEMVLRKMKQYD